MGQFRVAVRNGVLPERYVQLPVNYYGEVHMKHITRLSTLLLAVMLYPKRYKCTTKLDEII